MEQLFIYLVMCLVVFSWVMTPFLKKIVLKKIASIDLLIYTNIVVLFYIFFTFIILKVKYPGKYNFNSIYNLNKKEIIVLFCSALLTYLASISLIWLLKYNDAIKIMPQLQPVVIILTILVGVFIFKENITFNETIGIIFIIIGVFIINISKYKSIKN